MSAGRRPERDCNATIVALTGGIASGKGAVTEGFRRRNVPVFDADHVARDLVQPGQPALAEIAAAFGSEMLLADGALDRARMRERVFADPGARRRLESILHPGVRSALVAAVRECTAPYCVLVIPLLAEVRADYDFVDRVLAVDVPPQVQQQRLVARDRCTPQAAAAMIAAQAARADRLAIADDVVDNAGEIGFLDPIVDRLDRLYRSPEARRTSKPSHPSSRSTPAPW